MMECLSARLSTSGTGRLWVLTSALSGEKLGVGLAFSGQSYKKFALLGGHPFHTTKGIGELVLRMIVPIALTVCSRVEIEKEYTYVD